MRTMTFVPQDGTPMEKTTQNSFLSELLNIAVMRILFPDKLIPASLDVDGLAGLKDRLQAGANTEVDVDEAYDCKRIIAPAKLKKEEAEQLFSIGRKLAEALKIKGIFDIEVICHKGTLKLLEVDARVPSQTPISVYHSCGFNMIEAMIQFAIGKPVCQEKKETQVVMYQQIVVSEQDIKVLGEHVMGTCKRLHREKNFFGALDAITDYEPGADNFSAIVVTAGNTQEEAYVRFENCVKQLADAVGKTLALIEG